MDFRLINFKFLVFLSLMSMVHLQSPVLPYDTSDGPLKKGIIFHEDKKILLAEKFVNIQFLLPFPQFDVQIQKELTHLTSVLETLWKMPSYNCNLKFTNLSMEGFNVDWLRKEVQNEIDAATAELQSMQQETASFLKPISPNSADRTKRAVPVAAAALGAIGLFGAGITMGPGSCGLSGIFGSCQSDKNAANINRLFDVASSLSDSVQELNEETNDKFYIVSKELHKLHDLQEQMRSIQNANREVMATQMDTFKQDMHLMRNCDQMLYSRQQINFNFDTVSSLLSLFYSNIKSYRAALFAYRINLLNSIPALLSKYVPMSLLSKESLEIVLNKVAIQQIRALDRLTLAIPIQELLSYYEAQLLQDVLTLPHGLMLTMSIPLASRRTVMTTYQALPLPMPQVDDVEAVQWEIESEYLAVSEDGRETALISRNQLDMCIGSSRYSICHEGLATEGVQSSCLSLLFFGNLVQAMKVCDVKPVTLPIKERAVSLRYGIWLITAASADYTLTESYMNSSTPVGSSSFPGCRICVVTLACGKQISGPNIRIRSDLQSCSKIPATIMNVDLPVPLSNVLTALPSIDELPMYATRSQANIALLKSIKDEIKYVSPALAKDDDTLHQIAKPVAIKMTHMKHMYSEKFDSLANFRTTIIMGIVSFIISMALHILFTFLYFRYAPLRRLLSFTHHDKTTNKKIKLRPLLTVHDDDFHDAGHAPHEKLRSDAVLQTADQLQLRYGFFFAFIVLFEH